MTLTLTEDELALLSDALNELCHGIHLDDEELRIRTGFSREEARALLDRLEAALPVAPSPRTVASIAQARG